MYSHYGISKVSLSWTYLGFSQTKENPINWKTSHFRQLKAEKTARRQQVLSVSSNYQIKELVMLTLHNPDYAFLAPFGIKNSLNYPLSFHQQDM